MILFLLQALNPGIGSLGAPHSSVSQMPSHAADVIFVGWSLYRFEGVVRFKKG